MRNIILATIILLIFSCSNKDNSKGSNTDTPLDSAQIRLDILKSNVQYIGFIDTFYFSNNNEVYVQLFYRSDDFSFDSTKITENLADSLVFEDEESRRSKFPDNLSPFYFDLRGLSKLNIYDSKSNFICEAEFVRVEHLVQSISSSFIAVYKTEKKIKGDSFLGISNVDDAFEKQSFILSKDTVLTQKILKKLNEKIPYNGLKNNGTHLHFTGSDTIISMINSESDAYIVLTTKTDVKVLYRSEEDENIIDLIVIPMKSNALPHILTRNVMPETDVIWDKLLVYDGTNYKLMERQRIKK